MCLMCFVTEVFFIFLIYCSFVHSLQAIQLCHEIIKTEYAVLSAPAESPTRLKPVLERRSRSKKVVAAADDDLVQSASDVR
jgi:hypothetical protein